MRRSEILVDEILKLVQERGLRPGDALPRERQLAEHFGVSRNVLREAFGVLDERGLLRSVRGSGRYLREAAETAATLGPRERIEAASIADILEARTLLEVAVAGLACERRTTEQAAGLRALAERLHTWRDNVAFHCALAAATHNFMLERLVREQAELARQLHQRERYDDPEELERMRSEHEAIADAVAARDADLAERLMRAHLLRTRRLLVRGRGR
jgi:GntR family transcriptional regulator, transcriptional repressor for pyruvate dehydrogenase complex